MVEDVQDLVVLGASDAYGNLGEGTRTGVEVRGAAPLSPLIPDAELRFSGMWQDTSVTDSVTGEDRRFSQELEWTYNLTFRQEFAALKSAWGASAARGSDRWEYKRIEDILIDRPGDRVDLFWETTAIKGVTLRFTSANIFHAEEFRTRTFYSGTRASGAISRTEERKQKGGPEGTQVFFIRASGTF